MDNRSTVEETTKRNKNTTLIICIVLISINMFYKIYHNSDELISIPDLILIGIGVCAFIIPIENIKRIGTEKAFILLRKATDSNTQKIEELHNAMFLFLKLNINHNKLDHLSNLITNKQDLYNIGNTLKEELRDLRCVGYIESISACNISDLPDRFILSDHFKITQEGRDCFEYITRPLQYNKSSVIK